MLHRLHVQIAGPALGVLALTAAPLAIRSAAPIDWAQVDRAMGKPGAMMPGDVYRFAFPRSDLAVTLDGVTLKPALALGGWIAFKQTGDHDAMAMGDLVLREEEVGPVIAKLREAGVEQTALHNHLLRESPRLLYLHVSGHGDPTTVAAAIHAALALTTTPLAASAPAASPAGAPALDTAALASTLGRSGKLNGSVYQLSVPRAETIRDGGMDIPPSMGVATAINIQPTTPGKAVTTGDFVLLATEVNPVIQALTEHGIAITAVHSHMLTEEPRLFFLHFWGNADPTSLARGLRAAIDATNSHR
jgi:Domain of Unknown Function (DUF1259)